MARAKINTAQRASFKPKAHATDHSVTVATSMPSSHQRPHKIISLWNASNTRNMLISLRNNKHHQLLSMNIINSWVAQLIKASLLDSSGLFLLQEK